MQLQHPSPRQSATLLAHPLQDYADQLSTMLANFLLMLRNRYKTQLGLFRQNSHRNRRQLRPLLPAQAPHNRAAIIASSTASLPPSLLPSPPFGLTIQTPPTQLSPPFHLQNPAPTTAYFCSLLHLTTAFLLHNRD